MKIGSFASLLPTLLAAGLLCSGQTVKVINPTSTQAAMLIQGYTGPCNIEVSSSPSYTPLVPDVSGAEYTSSNVDTSRPDTYTWLDKTRVVTLGHQTGDRALQQDTRHYWRISGCGSTVTGSFVTGVPGIGGTYPPAMPFNSANWGNSGYPRVDWTARKQTLIDPLTGIRILPVNVSGDWSWSFGPTGFGYFAGASGWTNTAAILNGSIASVATTSNTNPIDIYADTNPPFDDPWGSGGYPRSIDDLGLIVYGSGSSATLADRQITACIVLNPVEGCIGAPFTIQLPAGAVAKVPGSSSDPDKAWPNNYPHAELAGWGNALIRQENYSTHGTLSAAAGALSIGAPTSFSHFSTALKAGARIFIAGADPTCPNNLCTIAAVVDAAHATINESLTLSNAAYKCFGWGVRIVKTNSAGTASVGLQMKVAGSANFKIQAEEDKCGPVPVVSGDGITGHPCFLYSATNAQAFLYFFGNEGTIRRISGMVIPNAQISTWPAADQPNGAVNFAAAPWGFDATRGNVFYVKVPTNGGRNSVFSATYSGDWTTDLDYHYTMAYDGFIPQSPSDQMIWANVMPPSQNKDLAALVATAYPAYNSAIYGSWNNAGFAGISQGFAVFYVEDNGTQDQGPGWVAAVDLTIPAVTMVVHTLDGSGLNGGHGSLVQWGTLHAAPALSFPAKWAAIATNALVANNSNLLLGGPFQVTPNAVLRSGAWSPNTALPWPPNNTYDNACPVSNPYVSLGATGTNCVTLRFVGQPCNIAPSATEKANFPACGWNGNFTQPVGFAPGMLFDDPAVPPDSERFRIISVTPLGGGIVQIVAQRNATQDYCCVTGTRPYCVGSAAQSTHSTGWLAQMSPGSLNSCAGTAGLVDLTSNSFYEMGPLFNGHYDISKNGPNISFMTSGNVKYNIPATSVAALPTTFYLLGNPTFGDPTFGSVQGQVGSNLEQAYPSASQYAAPPSDAQWMLDTNATNPGFAAGIENIGNVISPRTFTRVSGNIYDIQVVGGAYNPKLTPLFGWAGRFVLQDVSAANSDLTTAPDYSMCFAMRAGECISGGTQGHAYVRVPFAYDTGYCVSSQSWANSPCVMVGLPAGGSFRQRQVSQPDPNGLGSRFLSYMGFGPGREYTFSKAIVHPSGKWGVVEAPGWFDGVRMLAFLMEVPRWKPDTQTRNTFAGVQVDIPGGQTYAEVQFGYSRYGSPTQFYCTPRAEGCNTSSAARVPFNFESETRTLTTCTNGCKISIPALSGNLLYYRVRHSTDGSTWTNDDTQVSAVP